MLYATESAIVWNGAFLILTHIFFITELFQGLLSDLYKA